MIIHAHWESFADRRMDGCLMNSFMPMMLVFVIFCFAKLSSSYLYLLSHTCAQFYNGFIYFSSQKSKKEEKIPPFFFCNSNFIKIYSCCFHGVLIFSIYRVDWNFDGLLRCRNKKNVEFHVVDSAETFSIQMHKFSTAPLANSSNTVYQCYLTVSLLSSPCLSDCLSLSLVVIDSQVVGNMYDCIIKDSFNIKKVTNNQVNLDCENIENLFKKSQSHPHWWQRLWLGWAKVLQKYNNRSISIEMRQSVTKWV